MIREQLDECNQPLARLDLVKGRAGSRRKIRGWFLLHREALEGWLRSQPAGHS